MGIVPIFYLYGMDLHKLLETTVTGLGYELVDLEQSARGRMLRIFIDRPEGGAAITVEDCVTVSNQLTRVLMVEEVDYDRLEVSSPGLDRVLKKAADFARFAGSDVQIKVRVPVNGRRNWAGVLLGMQDDKVRLQADSGEVLLDLSQIDKARLVPRFN
jgi:ribosome maturation factor RimP